MRNVLGYLVTVVAALCWGASGVSADYLMEHHGVELTLISFFRMFVSGILVLGTVVAFTAYLWGVDRIGPVKASLIGSLEPFAATAFSALVMGSSYTGIDIVGMALIVGAVVTISVVDLLRARRVTQ